MVFSCAICSEGLEKPPATNPGDAIPQLAEGAAKVSATPCGHVFHTFCISKWTSGTMASSGSCPCCRKQIHRRVCLSLFPDSYDESFREEPSSSQFSAEEAAAVRLAKQNYEKQIQKLKAELQTQKEETATQSQLYQMQCAEYQEVATKFELEQHRSETFLVKWKKCESFKEMYEDADKKYTKLVHEIDNYNYIKGHLNLVECETEDDVRHYAKYSKEDAIRNISGLKNVLQREFRNMVKKRDEDKLNIDRLMQDKAIAVSKSEQYKSRSIEQMTMIEHLKQDNVRLRREEKDSKKRKDAKSGHERKAEETNLFKKHALPMAGSSLLDDSVIICSPPTPDPSLDDSVVMICDSDPEPLSPLIMRIRSNIPGVPPMTPNPPQKKFKFRKQFQQRK